MFGKATLAVAFLVGDYMVCKRAACAMADSAEKLCSQSHDDKYGIGDTRNKVSGIRFEVSSIL